jgi:hypothetical protein
MSQDLLAARVTAIEARLLETGGSAGRAIPPPPPTPRDALAARARAVEAQLAKTYGRGRRTAGEPKPQSDSPG